MCIILYGIIFQSKSPHEFIFGTEIFKFLKMLLYHFYIWATLNNHSNLIISLVSMNYLMWLHICICYQFSIIRLPKLFLWAGWKVAEGKGFNRSKLLLMEKHSTLINIDTLKELLAGSFLVWLHSFYFFHHPVTEFAHFLKGVAFT